MKHEEFSGLGLKYGDLILVKYMVHTQIRVSSGFYIEVNNDGGEVKFKLGHLLVSDHPGHKNVMGRLGPNYYVPNFLEDVVSINKLDVNLEELLKR